MNCVKFNDWFNDNLSGKYTKKVTAKGRKAKVETSDWNVEDCLDVLRVNNRIYKTHFGYRAVSCVHEGLVSVKDELFVENDKSDNILKLVLNLIRDKSNVELKGE